MKILPAKNLKLSDLDSFKEYVYSKKFIVTNNIEVSESVKFLVFDSSAYIKSSLWGNKTYRRIAILEKESFRVEGNSTDNSLTFFRYKEFTPENFYSTGNTYDKLYKHLYNRPYLKDIELEAYFKKHPYSGEIPFLTLEIVYGKNKIGIMKEGLIENTHRTAYYLKYHKQINGKYRFKHYKYGT